MAGLTTKETRKRCAVNNDEFERLLSRSGLISNALQVQAARDHMVSGMTQAEAARNRGINHSNVSRAVAAILSASNKPISKCPMCGNYSNKKGSKK